MNRTVRSRAELVVIRAYPPSALLRGQRIQLQYERLPEEDLGMNGPDVPPLVSGSIFVVPLKANPKPSSEDWRLIADEGGGTVIPAIEGESSFPNRPRSGREYLLNEVASALSAGTREELLRETSYLTSQKTNGYASEMMKLLGSQIKEDTDRWALVAAALVSPLGIPRPTIADFIRGEYGADGTSWRGSLAEMSIRRLAKSSDGKEKLIRQFLNLSNLNEWGTGIALRNLLRPKPGNRTPFHPSIAPSGFTVCRLRCDEGGSTQHRRDRYGRRFFVFERRIQTPLRYSGRVLDNSRLRHRGAVQRIPRCY